MSITTLATKAAYEAAAKPTDNARLTKITEDKSVKIDGVNDIIPNRSASIGDALCIDANNNHVWIAGKSLRANNLLSGLTYVGRMVSDRGDKALVMAKDGAGNRYADIVQMAITAISSTSITIKLRMKGDYATDTTINVTLSDTELSAANAAAISNALNAGGVSGNTGYSNHKWWAYLDEDNNRIVVQCDMWEDYRMYIVSGTGCTISHITWGTMPESSFYSKNNGVTTNYWGCMNIARTKAWATSNGLVPTTDVPIKNGANDAPVRPDAFESSIYCKLLRDTYGTYENYLRECIGVRYPQAMGCFSLPSGKELTNTYGIETAPVKDGSTKYKYPAMHYCLSTGYGSGDLAIGKWWLPGVEEGAEFMRDEVADRCGISNSTHRWFAQRYDVCDAWYFNGGNGTLNSYGGVYYGYHAQAVTLCVK